MAVHASRLISREFVAHDTLAATIERPEGFTFAAGQYIDVTLPDMHYSDDLGPVRSFSIASAPSEENLLLVMRMRPSAFKRTLVELPIGAPIAFEGPLDDLSFVISSDRQTALIAGGVGIAPFLSGMRELAAGSGTAGAATSNVVLFYSNPRPEDAAYLQELEQLSESLPGFSLVATMTRMADSDMQWQGETGRFNAGRLSEHLSSLQGPRYFISGSPGFISGFVQMLQRSGVPVSDVDVEMYTGY